MPYNSSKDSARQLFVSFEEFIKASSACQFQRVQQFSSLFWFSSIQFTRLHFWKSVPNTPTFNKCKYYTPLIVFTYLALIVFTQNISLKQCILGLIWHLLYTPSTQGMEFLLLFLLLPNLHTRSLSLSLTKRDSTHNCFQVLLNFQQHLLPFLFQIPPFRFPILVIQRRL